MFTYLVSEIGESRDIYRFDIEQNDLNEATILYNFFKGNKINFVRFNTDPRCKIFSIDKFKPDTSWTIDKWWSADEKITLGIEEEYPIINFTELPIIIEEMTGVVNSISMLIKDANKINTDLSKNFKEVKISDIFEIKKGSSKYTNTYFNNCIVKLYDVYSSQTTNNGIIAKIDTFDYDCECLTWTTDGYYAGAVFYRNGKFSMTTHCGALVPKFFNGLSIEFLKYKLKEILPQMAQGESNKRVTVDIIKKVTILMPVLADGRFDLKTQESIVQKYHLINEFKNKVTEYEEIIRNINIKI